MQDPQAKLKGEAGILDLIDELEELINDDFHLFNRAFWVDVDEFFAMSNKIRLALPQEIRKAERFVKDSARLMADGQAQADRIVQEARKEADRIVQEAGVKAEQITADTEITRAATIRAKQTMQEAEEHAREIKKGADDYARDVLENLDDYIARVMGSIRQGRDKLEPRR
jgi:cell division septum initiation protein DivIVA